MNTLITEQQPSPPPTPPDLRLSHRACNPFWAVYSCLNEARQHTILANEHLALTESILSNIRMHILKHNMVQLESEMSNVMDMVSVMDMVGVPTRYVPTMVREAFQYATKDEPDVLYNAKVIALTPTHIRVQHTGAHKKYGKATLCITNTRFAEWTPPYKKQKTVYV